MEKYSKVAVLEFGNTYSGYAVLEKGESKTNQPWKLKSGKRVSTCIFFNEDRKSEVFRHATEDNIGEHNEKGDNGNFFKQFLLNLIRDQKIDNKLKYVNKGTQVTAGFVFDEFIMALINDLTNEPNEDPIVIKSDTIKWIITVPNDLTDIAKERIEVCAVKKAGIPHDQLTMVTELQAVSAFCQKYLERDQYSKLEDSSEYMIVDLQDCVVDIRVVKRIGDKIIEKYKTSLSVYEKFLRFLKENLGKENVDSFLKDWPFASSDFKRELKDLAFEKRKISLGSLIQFYEKDFIKTPVQGDSFKMEDDNLILDEDTFNSFQLPINVIIIQMETVLAVYQEACKVKFMVITGDVDACGKNAIEIKFPQKRIIFSKSIEEAVMNGVVLYRNQPYQFYSEVPRIIADGSNYTTVVALHFGTTYCGYAFSFQTDPGDIHIQTSWICNGNASSRKTASCICVNDDCKILAFGYEAETQYAENLKQNEDTCMHFVRPLKSLLLNEKEINFNEWTLMTTKGIALNGALTVKAFIAFLIDHSMEEIKRQSADITIDKIRWVITVPVGLTNNTGKFLKGCISWLFNERLEKKLNNEGVSEDEIEKQLQKNEHQQLMITTEAEATFAYCQKFLESDQYSKLENSTEYMIVNLGGWFVDVRVVKKVNDTVIEICRRSPDYNSNSAYTNMLEILENTTKKSQDNPKTAASEDFLFKLDIERVLEEAKCNPSAFKELLQKFINKHDIHKDGTKMEVDGTMFGIVFLPRIDNVLSEMESVFRDYKEAHKILYIVMTGDFYECCLLKNAVEVKFPQKRIIFSNSDEEAVMKGAVLFGRQPFQYTLKSLHVYEKKPEQKGLLLVINYTFSGDKTERKGSDEDVKKLRSFFINLNYDVLCWSDKTKYMSTEKLKKKFKKVKDSYLTENSGKYHCFICVIMSHGDEGIIQTSDSIITVVDLIEPFKNDKAKQFIGKPKIFMIQTCRGDLKQGKYTSPGPRGGAEQDITSLRMPKDSDILTIYASTPGYPSRREPTSPKWKGAWLIQAFLCVAKQYPKNHLLELLTAVNFELAHNPEYECFEEKCQVSISESALSKLFYL